MPNCTVVDSVLENHLTDALAMDDVVVDYCHSLARVDQHSIAISFLTVAKFVLVVASLVRPL